MNEGIQLITVRDLEGIEKLLSLSDSIVIKVDHFGAPHDDGRDADELFLKKNKSGMCVVYTAGATKVKSFASIFDAWCEFTLRLHRCPVCKGGDIDCIVCHGFGKVTRYFRRRIQR